MVELDTSALVPGTRAAVRAAPRVRVAGFWRRALAGVVDVVLVATIFALLCALAAALLGRQLPRWKQLGPDFFLDVVVNGDPLTWAATGLFVGFAVAYTTVFHATTGQTPGKRLLGLRVIDAYGDRPGLARAGLRAVAGMISMAVALLGFFWIAFDREKRALHDWLADTYVIVGSVG